MISREESDDDDTAELAAVVLDKWEVIRRKDERIKTLHKTFQNGERTWYRCLACLKPSVVWMMREREKSYTTRHLLFMQNHMNEEHRDKLDEVVSVMRKELLARKRANHGGRTQCVGKLIIGPTAS